MKRILIIALFCCVNLSAGHLLAQDSIGILFTKELSWQQIKEKARKENKYIFLDAFTTNCARCIKMDKEIFSQKKVSGPRWTFSGSAG